MQSKFPIVKPTWVPSQYLVQSSPVQCNAVRRRVRDGVGGRQFSGWRELLSESSQQRDGCEDLLFLSAIAVDRGLRRDRLSVGTCRGDDYQILCLACSPARPPRPPQWHPVTFARWEGIFMYCTLPTELYPHHTPPIRGKWSKNERNETSSLFMTSPEPSARLRCPYGRILDKEKKKKKNGKIHNPPPLLQRKVRKRRSCRGHS